MQRKLDEAQADMKNGRFPLKKRERPVIIKKTHFQESDRNDMKQICAGILAHVSAV